MINDDVNNFTKDVIKDLPVHDFLFFNHFPL